MKKRGGIYIFVGIVFGVFDFYFQGFTQGISSYLVSCTVIFSIWLVPFIPVVLYEAKASGSKRMSAWAGILTWSMAIISYYLFMFIKLVLIGQATMQDLYIANYKAPYYWRNLGSVLVDGVLGGIAEWIGLAIVGGGILGYLVSFIYLRFRKTRCQ